jgi:uridylate kinase
MKSIVISIGGSVILSDDIDDQFFNKLADLISRFSKNYKIYIVVGGGKSARDYIKLGRKLNIKEDKLDIFGILITRINAKLLKIKINDPNLKIPKTTEEALKMKKRIVIMGGTIPGHSTDYVGSELALKSKASKFIIATNVDGVYDKDPNIYHNAKQIKEITAEELINKYGISWKSAGSNVIIDGPALKKIQDNNILTYVLNGKKIEELENALKDKKFNGTIIKKEKR